LNIAVFTLTACVAFIWVPIEAFLHGFDMFEVGTAVALFIYCGMSITAGYHRLWSHRTYQTTAPVRIFYAIGGAFALQNSILHWTSDHRVHHKHVDDNEQDPYSAGKGFWHSHIGWMLREYQANRYSDYSNCRDLQNDPVVVWQHKYYLPLTLATNIGVPCLLGWFNGDVFGMLLMAGFLRLVLSHHTTFLINSAAHKWGEQPYTEKNSARDNPLLALFTFGEGYHNFHHLFEVDYRNCIRWYHFDPTKWLIKSLEILGLATKLRTYSDDKIEKARLKMQLSTLTQLANMKSIDTSLVEKINTEYEALIKLLDAYYASKKSLLELKAQNLMQDYQYLDLMHQYKAMKSAFILQKEKWLIFNKHVIRYV
jgi:stearoyl-CoA desaturase (delta-9 desaturase)